LDCLDARAALFPEESLRLATAELLEARMHVERCVACRSHLRMDRDLRERLRGLGQVEAPHDVRERIYDAIARSRAGGPGSTGPLDTGRGWARRRGWSKRIGGAVVGVAGLTVAVILSLALLNEEDPGEGGDVVRLPQSAAAEGQTGFVEDFLRRAVQAEHIRSSDPREVANFLARELGFTGYLLPPADLDLSGAEVCIVDGIRGAVVIYKKDGRVLYHYLIPRPGVAARAPGALGAVGTQDPPLPGRSEELDPDVLGVPSFPSVVTWASDGMEEALVGDFPVASLLDMAHRRSL